MPHVNNLHQRSLGGINILLSSTLRISLVFLLLLSSLTCLLSSPFAVDWSTSHGMIVLMAANGVLCFHHWVGMTQCETLRTKPRFGTLVDFILLIAECTAALWVRPWNFRVGRYDETRSITFTCAVFVEVTCLCLLLMIRSIVIVTNFIREPSTALAKPFDFFAMSNDEKAIDHMINRLHSGSSFSHARSWFLFLVKSSCIFVIMMLLLASLFTNLVLEPVHETGMTPMKLYTTRVPDFEVSEFDWNIVAVFIDKSGQESESYSDAIQVKALWVNESDTNPPCDFRNLEIADRSPFKYIQIDCPFRLSLADETIDIPDILITVNFTALGINATSLSDYRSRTVSIAVGLHNDTVDILRNTLAIPLVPDTHLLGPVLVTLRYEYKNPVFASLGAFSSTRKYITTIVPFLTPDPSSQILRDNNTATLRLYMPMDDSDWRVSVDYREKSILSGISVVGGLWTVANGVFATIFGTTLWWALFGAKPLSTFGLIHKIPKFKPVLEDEVHRRRYPNLLSEGQSDGGLLDYIKENFVDLGLFEERDEVANEEPDPEKT